MMIIIILLIIISIIISKSIVNNNNKYLDKTLNKIKEKVSISDKVTYFNIYGNYYILTTTNNIVVLNKEYEEVLKEDIKILATNENELIYKNNKLMYEETLLKDDLLTYKYYDATNNELIKETTMKEEVR